MLGHAGLREARLLVVTAPEPFQARAIIDIARRIQPAIDIAVRTHSDAERTYLEHSKVGMAVMGEQELTTRRKEALYEISAARHPLTVRGHAYPLWRPYRLIDDIRHDR